MIAPTEPAGAASPTAGVAPPAVAVRSPYIVGPWYDWAFFLLPPLLALIVGGLIAGTPFNEAKHRIDGRKVTWAGLLIGTLIHAHLGAVVLRSHVNATIFRRHPLRFTVVPLAAFAAMMTSMWALACATVLVTFWDVYHSGLQTFGLARIYDRNRGNDPAVGRWLDLGLNHLLYAGPVLGGASLLAHTTSFEAFDAVGADFLTGIPPFLDENQRFLTWAICAGGVVYLVVYVVAYRGLSRRGYAISPLKVWLLASTGLCSIFVWGFNPWGQAFFIMNLFHAVQYLALVWWAEGRSLRRRLRLDTLSFGGPLATAVFLGGAVAYGYWAEMAPSNDRVAWSIAQVVALMHFWYDGFIWSVSRRQI